MGPAGHSFGDGSDDGDAYRVALRFFPPNPWTRSAEVSRESAAYHATVEEARAAEWALAVEVRRLFAELAYLQKDLTEVQGLVELRRKLCDTMKQRADRGLATLEDTADVSRRYLNTLRDLGAARQQRDRVRSQLARLVDLPVATLKINTAALTESDTTYIRSNFASLETEALGRSAVILARSWRVQAARAAYREARAQSVPWFNHIQADYAASSESSSSHSYGMGAGGSLSAPAVTEYDYTDDDSDGTEWGVSAAISLPVFSWFSHTPDLLRAEFEFAEEQLDAAHEAMRSNIRHALDLTDAMKNNRRQHDETIAPATRELEELLARADTPNAPLDPDRALRIREELVESRRMALEMEYDYRTALIDLEEALGLGFAIRAE